MEKYNTISGMTFWGSSPCGNKIFTLPKKIDTVMVGAKPRYSHRGLFKRLEIFSFMCLYIFISEVCWKKIIKN